MFINDIFAETTDDDIAYISADGQLNRRDLLEKSERLARYFIEKNYSKPIIIYGHKSRLYLICLLACLRAGIPYVPCEKAVPQSRIASMIADSGAFMFLCTEGEFHHELPVINENEILNIISNEHPNKTSFKLPDLSDTAYIIFTSGSTGTPKGVSVTYGNIQAFLNFTKTLEPLEKIDSGTILNIASFSFDLSVCDLYLSLTRKLTLFAIENSLRNDMGKLFEQMKKSNARAIVMTPSYAQMCLCDRSFSNKLLPNLETIFFCGEELKPNTAKKIFERFGNIPLINAYGPTECTCSVTASVIRNDSPLPDILPCGNTANVRLHKNGGIINGDGEGEIVIFGESVAKGYCSSSHSGFSQIDGKKCYFTGDYGRIKQNQLYWLSRIDNQLKVNGFRIEPRDVETAILKLPFVSDCSVFVQPSSLGKRLAARIIVAEDTRINLANLRSKLLEYLPPYMIPSIIKISDRFKVAESGKIKKIGEQ